MTPQPKLPNLTSKDESAIVAITSGLLASGHFTYPIDTERGDEEPGVLVWDSRAAMEDGLARSAYTPHVVDHAIDVLRHIKYALEEEPKL